MWDLVYIGLLYYVQWNQLKITLHHNEFIVWHLTELCDVLPTYVFLILSLPWKHSQTFQLIYPRLNYNALVFENQIIYTNMYFWSDFPSAIKLNEDEQYSNMGNTLLKDNRFPMSSLNDKFL